MPHRCSTPSLAAAVLIIAALVAVLIIFLTPLPAQSAEQIPCWKARALLSYAGSSDEAEKLAQRHGYTKSQIAEVRRRCGL